MVIELGSSVSNPSTGSQNDMPFSPLTDFEYKLHKTGIENLKPIGFSLGLS